MSDSPLKLWQRVLAVREGGYVERIHAMPHIIGYNVAQHAWNATALLLLLHPDPSVNLIKHIMFHDVAERWVGDIPYPARKEHTALGEAEAEATNAVDRILGVCDTLTLPEYEWLVSLDMLEFFMWCNDELAMGNKFVEGQRQTAIDILQGMKNTAPQPVWEVYLKFRPDHMKGYRNSDFLSKMLKEAKIDPYK